MLILGIECSERSCSAALLDGDRIAGSVFLDSGLTHSEKLVPMINGLMSLSGREYGDIGLYGVAAGPGSFTGVRIGVSTVKGLAFPFGTPCAGLSSLFCMACGFTGRDGFVLPAMDARRGQVYGALFGISGGKVERLTPDLAVPAEELAARAGVICPGETVTVCGGGAGLILREDGRQVRFVPAPPELRSESAVSVALAAKAVFESGSEPLYPGGDGLRPIYLRPSQAERARDEKSGGDAGK